jgi:hypothetical protein
MPRDVSRVIHSIFPNTSTVMNTQDEAAALSALQHTFDVTALGSGDPVVGFNLLAAQACTLANLAPDDGSVVHKDGRVARLGASLLVHGAASAGGVVDEIISEVSKRQANLTNRCQTYLGWRAKNNDNPNAFVSKDSSESEAANLFLHAGQEIQPLFGKRADLWIRAMETAPNEADPHLAGRPKFLVSAGKHGDLENELRGLRPGRPLVHLGFSSPENLTQFSETVPALMESRYTLGNGVVRGNIIVTDPMLILVSAASDPSVKTDWLGQLLWLTDGEAGPQPPGGEIAHAPEDNPMIVERFQAALSNLMARRLGNYQDEPHAPLRLIADVGPAIVRWTEFLRKMEASIPGVSGACRNLLTSLIFGLGEMAKIETALKFTVAGVEAFARYLVRRMANARMMILRAGEIARMQQVVGKIFAKICSGVSCERKIGKDFKIAAVERDKALRWLSQSEMIYRGSEGWLPCEGARLDFSHCTLPLLEV